MNVGAVNFKGLLKVNPHTYINTDKIESIYTSKGKDITAMPVVNIVTDNSSYRCPDDVRIDNVLKAYCLASKKKDTVVNTEGRIIL